jgi:DNA-binding response OmpR family regulator
MITGRSQFRGNKSHRNSHFFMELQLIPKEFRLLEHLLKRAGIVLTRSQLLTAAWGFALKQKKKYNEKRLPI